HLTDPKPTSFSPLQIPQGTQSHTRIRLTGKGVKRVSSHGYGDHYVNIKIKIPTKLTQEQTALLTALAELEMDTPGTISGITYAKDGKKRTFEEETPPPQPPGDRQTASPSGSRFSAASSERQSKSDEGLLTKIKRAIFG
ncbi:protein tumorous imaginal discs, mitochondrial-like, partial [Homarus americanus]|uniref:protein tumorous imaginal discs, mitochondrial-like n=1 Tax=Homarus americanus TaxID=6706 RepID=UPI001C468639